MRIHNYAKYASIHIYVFLVSVAFNLLFFSTYISLPKIVTHDAFRIIMGVVFVLMFIFSAIWAIKSVIKAKAINQIKLSDFKTLISSKNNKNDFIANIEEKYNGLINIQEKYNEENILSGIVITQIDYQPFWFEVVPFSINITIVGDNLSSWECIADKSFFDRDVAHR